jgi:transposase
LKKREPPVKLEVRPNTKTKQEVLKMNQNEKLRMIKEGTMVTGIDIAKEKHGIQPMLHNGITLCKPFKINNTRDGFKNLVLKLEQIKESNNCKEIIFGLEPTGHYWKALTWYLTQKGYTVVLVNPYHVKKSKEFDDNSPSKNDFKDPKVIGKLVIEGRFFEIYQPTGPWSELRTLSVNRNQLKEKENAVLNNVHAVVDEYFPEYETVFKELTGKASLQVLTNCPMPEDLKVLGVHGIVTEFKKAVKKGVGKKRAELLYKAACDSIGVPANKAIRLKLKLLVQELHLLVEQIATIEAEMVKQLKATGISQYILSIPGVGVVTAAGILAEIGDPNRFTHWKQIRKLAGFNLVEDSSGKHQSRRIISKRGRFALRSYLYQVAFVMVAQNLEFKQLYSYLTKRQSNPLKKKQALVVIAIKLIKIMISLIKHKELYDSTKVLGSYRQMQIAA